MAIRRLNPWTDINDIDFTTLSILRMGTSGADTMRGGAGRDTFYGYGSDDTFIGNGGVDKFFGGEGTDTVDYSNMATAAAPESFFGRTGVVVNLASGVGGEINEGMDSYSSIENVTGSNFKDFLIGDDKANVLRGMNDDDMIEGGLGGDTLDGGEGNDTLSYAGSDLRVTVNLETRVTSGGHASGDVISLFENLIGSAHNDTLTGNSQANIIAGGAGGDTLNGGVGVNDLNDTVSYRFSNAGVTVNLLTNTASGGHAASDTIRNFENIEGSFQGDTLTGSGLANTITGLGGIDIINGGRGNDTIEGGADDDIMTGGADLDTFVFKLGEDSGNDHITDFNVLQDKIQLGVGETYQFDSVDIGGGLVNVILTFADGDTLTLDNIDALSGLAVFAGFGIEYV